MNLTQFENYFTGKCTAEESRSTEQWINANIDSEEFVQLSREMLENMPYSDRSETRRAYRRLRLRVASTCGMPVAPAWKKKLRDAGIVAAVAAVAFASAFFFTQNLEDKKAPEPVYSDLVQQYSRRGTSSKIILPDSTSVTLFADSRIIYDRNSFDTRRQVWLFGDAFFDVAAQDGGTTFDVKCLNTDIRVLGTSFEVLSHDEDNNFEVSLYKGSVRLTPQYNGHCDTMRLNPGDVVRIDKLSGTITRHTVPWLDNDTANVVYIGSTVNDILSRLERRYDKSIIFYDKSKKISETRLNLIYHPTDPLETVLSAICEFSDLEMSLQGDEIILEPQS